MIYRIALAGILATVGAASAISLSVWAEATGWWPFYGYVWPSIFGAVLFIAIRWRVLLEPEQVSHADQ